MPVYTKITAHQYQLERAEVIHQIFEKYQEVYGHRPSSQVVSTYHWATLQELKDILAAFDITPNTV